MSRPTLFGRYQVPETPSALMRLHWHRGGPLKEVDHEPRVAVLDQEDLLAQGIRVSSFIPGAVDVDALGSCTANAFTAGLSNVLDEATFLRRTGATGYADVKGAEEFAIRFYNACTHQTGDPATEWPPTDCGSAGPYVVREAQALGLVHDDRIAHGADNIVSLMQSDGLLVGSPWFRSWMEPDANGFIDGDGSAEALEAAIRSGVAGGHETYHSSIEKLSLTATDKVDPFATVGRARNSWTESWGDHGSYRYHLSTFVMLAQYVDMRQLVV